MSELQTRKHDAVSDISATNLIGTIYHLEENYNGSVTRNGVRATYAPSWFDGRHDGRGFIELSAIERTPQQNGVYFSATWDKQGYGIGPGKASLYYNGRGEQKPYKLVGRIEIDDTDTKGEATARVVWDGVQFGTSENPFPAEDAEVVPLVTDQTSDLVRAAENAYFRQEMALNKPNSDDALAA